MPPSHYYLGMPLIGRLRSQSVKFQLAKIFNLVISLFEKNEKAMLTYSINRFDDGGTSSDYDLFDVAIVIQGPVNYEHNFTLNCLQMYRKKFPNIILILSTWIDDANLSPLRSRIQELNVKVVLSEKPDTPGKQNTNYQITSTQAGIAAARENGARFILKIRTDQAVFYSEIFEYLFSFEKRFGHAFMENRITITSFNTFLHRLYSPTDQLQWGRIDIMEKFWGVDKMRENEINPHTGDLFFPEEYLAINFCKKVMANFDYSAEGYLNLIRNHFVIADESIMQLIWHKRGRVALNVRYGNTRQHTFWHQLKSWEWELLVGCANDSHPMSDS